MNEYRYTIDDLIERYPVLKTCKDNILNALGILIECFSSNHKLLIAGNGGSCCDAEHIVGELMKSFKKKRPISEELSNKLIAIDSDLGFELSKKLQASFPAIALNSHPGLNTAFTNDVDNGGLLTYAQQVNGYGQKGDVFLGISTSGNSKNIIYAAITAKAKGLKVISLTGKDGGKLAKQSDVSIIVPSDETFMIQELHLPIYHFLCLMIEESL